MIKRRIHEAFPSPLCFGQFRREASQHSSSGTDILDCFDASLRNIAPGGFDDVVHHQPDLVADQFRHQPLVRKIGIARLHAVPAFRSEEHTSELQSLMRTSYAVFCSKKKTSQKQKYYS